MKEQIVTAEKILRAWRGDSYTFGANVIDAVGTYANKYGGKALVVCGSIRRRRQMD